MAVLVLRNGKGSGAHGYLVQLVAAGGLLHLFMVVPSPISRGRAALGPRVAPAVHGFTACKSIGLYIFFFLIGWLSCFIWLLFGSGVLIDR